MSVEEDSEVTDNLHRLNNIGSNGQAPVGPRHLTEVRADPNHSTSVFFVFSWRCLDAHQLETAAIHSCMFDVIRRAFRGLALTCPCMSSANRWYIYPLVSLLCRSEADTLAHPAILLRLPSNKICS